MAAISGIEPVAPLGAYARERKGGRAATEFDTAEMQRERARAAAKASATREAVYRNRGDLTGVLVDIEV